MNSGPHSSAFHQDNTPRQPVAEPLSTPNVVDSGAEASTAGEGASSKVKHAKQRRSTTSAATPADQMRVASSGRRKVALPPGRSQLDWIRNSRELPRRTHGTYTLAELRKHNTQGDAWMAVRGVVYDVTPYLEYHPGGISIMMTSVGRDASKLFDKYHAWVNPQYMLERCVIGLLDERSVAEDDSDSN